MLLSLPQAELKAFLGRQLDVFFPDQYKFAGLDIDAAFDEALQRTEFCFKHISERGYVENGQVTFSHLHSDQYSQFLYFFGNSLWRRSQNRPICDKLTLLNKMLNSIFCSYKLALPDIFYLCHPVGTIIGHAEYADFLVILQNVTINTAPGLKIGKAVAFAAGANVIGNQPIGDRSSIGANSLVFHTEIPADSVAFSKDGGLTIKPRTNTCYAQRFFNVPLHE